MNVLSSGIPLARKHPEDFESMWSQLADSLDQLLFPKKYQLFQFELIYSNEYLNIDFYYRTTSVDDSEYSKEQLIEDETVDCQIIKFLKKEILSQSSSVPKEFVLKVVILLNKGSILSPSHDALISKMLWVFVAYFHNVRVTFTLFLNRTRK